MSEINDIQPTPASRKPGTGSRWIVLAGFILLLTLGALGGYQSALGQRRSAEATQITQQLDDQYMLAVQALDQGLYQIAIQNIQFVLQQDPYYPGAEDLLSEIVLHMSLSPTSTTIPSPTLSPTPDLRGAVELFNRARELLNAREWTGAVETLDSLRKTDPAYRTAEVDGMYYIALYNRGINKISNLTCSQINLAGGIYDLTLAERFGPLTSSADGLRSWAGLYLSGAAFWDVNWAQAQFYFGQVYPYLPNMRDSSCVTATERYRFASLKLAEQLAELGDYCGSKANYEIALAFDGPENPIVIPTAQYIYEQCPAAETPVEGGGAPAETATPTPTETPTPTPTP